MEFLSHYGKEIVALVAPVITWLLATRFRTRAQLVCSQVHAFAHQVRTQVDDDSAKEEHHLVYTGSHVVLNAGKETATGVEVIYNFKPSFLNLWSPRNFTTETTQDKRHVVKLASLSPGEGVTFETLSIDKELPVLVMVRCDQCVAKDVPVLPQPIPNPYLVVVLRLLAAVGLVASIYLVLVLLQWLVLRTPIPT